MSRPPESGNAPDFDPSPEREPYRVDLTHEEIYVILGALNAEHETVEDLANRPIPPSSEVTIEQIHQRQYQQELSAIEALRKRLIELVAPSEPDEQQQP